MGNVTFVLGFAGSGKTRFIDERLKVDHAFHENFAATAEHEKNHADLVSRLRRGQHCAVTELQYLAPENLDAYIARLKSELAGQVNVSVLCFEKDIDAANWNCRRPRKDKDDPTGVKHVKINKDWEPFYLIPPTAVVLRITRDPIPPVS